MAKPQRIVRMALGTTIALTVLGWTAYLVLGSRLYAAVTGRPSLLFEQGRPVLRMAVLLLGAQALALVLFGILRRPLQDLLFAKGHPTNLAVFRIAWFSYLFLWVDLDYITWFSRLPAQLRFPPLGSRLLLEMVPVNATWVSGAVIAFQVVCLLAAVGLFTRTSAWLSVLLGVYVLGIPQFYGKVSHYHHLLWFAAILAVSPCADVLSVDALRRGRRAAQAGPVEAPEPSWAYAIPLRLVWILMGLIYFFPGLWKMVISGWAWALSDNLKFQLYDKWASLGWWEPIFRIDQFPLLYKLAGLGTLLFELSFVFLVLVPRLRIWAAVGGLLFHQLTYLFMRIPFFALQVAYLSFVNWHRLFHALGGRLYREPMYLVHDRSSSRARELVTSVRLLDIFGGVTYLDREDGSALDSDVTVIVGQGRWAGRRASRALAGRVPLLWLVLPFLASPSPSRGRVGEGVTPQQRTVEEEGHARRPNARTAVAVGTLLILGSLAFGFLRIGDAWPMAVYPRFSSITGPSGRLVEITKVDQAGQETPVDDSSIREEMDPVKYHLLLRSVRVGNNPDRQSRQFEALTELLVKNVDDLEGARALRFYELEISTIPEKRSENPLSRTLLAEVEIAG